MTQKHRQKHTILRIKLHKLHKLSTNIRDTVPDKITHILKHARN